MQLDQIDIPAGKFILLGGGVSGEYGFSLCGTFDTIEEARAKKDEWVSQAPFHASQFAGAAGKEISPEILYDSDECLKYLGMTFDIYNDKKERVG